MKVTFYLNTRPAKTGERLIQTTLCANGYRLRLSTGLSVKPEDWVWTSDGKMKKEGPFVRRQAPDANLINQRLDLIRATMTYFEGTQEEAIDKYNALLGKETRPKKATATEKADRKATASLATSVIREFEIKEGTLCGWSENTMKKFKTLQNHLNGINPCLQCAEIDNDFLESFVMYLVGKGFKNTYVKKMCNIFRWFLKWAVRKKYITHDIDMAYLQPKLTTNKNPIIFLTKDELHKVSGCSIPEGKKHLEQVRDFFLFCCYTGLRYSDAASLTPDNVAGTSLRLTTKKDADALVIPLMPPALDIIERYKDRTDGLLLPVISNQKMNVHLKELCKLAGVDSRVQLTEYRGGARYDNTYEKWELVGTHCGRKTFICFALSEGIPPQVVMKITGHSDYSAMKPYIDIAQSSVVSAMDLLGSRL